MGPDGAKWKETAEELFTFSLKLEVTLEQLMAGQIGRMVKKADGLSFLSDG